MDDQANLSICMLLARKGIHPAGIFKVSESLLKTLSSLDAISISSINFDDFYFGKKIPSLLQKLVNMLVLSFYVPYYIRKNNTDVFLGTNSRLPHFLPKKCLKTIIVHDLVFKKHPKTMRSLSCIVDSLLVPNALNMSDIIFAISDSTAADIKEFYPQHAHKIQRISLAGAMNVNNDNVIVKANINHKITKPYVLFVGTIEPRKNLERLIEAFALLPIKHLKDFQLVICGGSGWGNVEIEAMIAKYNLMEQVIISGYVTDEELSTLYKKSYCLAFPSLYEGFGLPILEAHSFGIPVLTSNNSSMPEVAGKAAVYVDPFDVNSITSGLASLLEDRAFRDKLASYAVPNAKKFNWEITAQKILSVFRSEIAVRSKKIPIYSKNHGARYD